MTSTIKNEEKFFNILTAVLGYFPWCFIGGAVCFVFGCITKNEFITYNASQAILIGLLELPMFLLHVPLLGDLILIYLAIVFFIQMVCMVVNLCIALQGKTKYYGFPYIGVLSRGIGLSLIEWID